MTPFIAVNFGWKGFDFVEEKEEFSWRKAVMSLGVGKKKYGLHLFVLVKGFQYYLQKKVVTDFGKRLIYDENWVWPIF